MTRRDRRLLLVTGETACKKAHRNESMGLNKNRAFCLFICIPDSNIEWVTRERPGNLGPWMPRKETWCIDCGSHWRFRAEDTAWPEKSVNCEVHLPRAIKRAYPSLSRMTLGALWTFWGSPKLHKGSSNAYPSFLPAAVEVTWRTAVQGLGMVTIQWH